MDGVGRNVVGPESSELGLSGQLSEDWPSKWADIDSSHWQGKGRWAAPIHHMCSYMAMFPPELAHYFIQRFTQTGDRVLDPFCGRGTTPVEAAAQGRIGIGNDLNPLAIALTRGKLSDPVLDDVLSRLAILEAGYDASEWRHFSGAPNRIRMIYHVNTLRQLMYLKRELDWSKSGVDAFLTAVLMGALHGSSRGFLSVSMPNTFSMSENYIRSYVERNGLECPDRDAFEVLRTRVERMLVIDPLPGREGSRVLEGDARNLRDSIPEGSIQMIFTSPPYLKVIKYGQYNWIRLWFLGHDEEDVDRKLDDTHALAEYLEFMREVLASCLPMIDPDRGVAFWVIGDVVKNDEAIDLASEVARVSEEVGYKVIGIVDDEIPAEEKVTKIWKRAISVSVSNSEGVVESKDVDSKKEADEQKSKFEISYDESYEITIEVDDRSGKATPVDRILIIAPEDSEPRPFRGAGDVSWNPLWT